MEQRAEQVTQLLEALGAGEPRASERLLPLVYEELRRLAAARMAREFLDRRNDTSRSCSRISFFR